MGTIQKPKTFRDSISTIDESGNRKWIYPKKPSGKFYKWRTWTSYLLLVFLFGTPFIQVNGEPLLLFDVIQRKFIFFSIVFWPQDFFVFVLCLLILIISIAVFTSIFGRVWCGWTCPQTIFMEMVFRKIEYAIEGDASAQKKLNASAWTSSKIAKKAFKHIIFYLISFLIANTFLAYIIGIEELSKIITEPIATHLWGFVAIHVFTLLFYGVFAHFREQACTIVCPYGRYQSVLVNEDTIAVTYDYERGEPRGKLSKTEENNHGDCVDCTLCVQVCPTGIDIRNGIQLECVNCTACMDACDDVMMKIGKESGLIRYASNNSVKSKSKFKLTTRQYGYIAVLALLLVAAAFSIQARSTIDVTVLRQAGTLYQKIDETHISNLYIATIINKSNKEIKAGLKSNLGEIRYISQDLTVAKQSTLEIRFFLILSSDEINSEKIPVNFSVTADEVEIDLNKSMFIAPILEKK